MTRQPDDPSGQHSTRCLVCGGPGARVEMLCRGCDEPAPWWAHIPLIRLIPSVRARWF